MNLPNKLTVLRMMLIPVFLLCYFMESLWMNYLWALIIFAVASITDALDGNIARKRGLVTDFGKLMDPLADKLLVISAFICLLQGNTLLVICLILIVSRELLVTSLRLLAAGKGIVLAADRWGKLKTILQMTWICLDLLLLVLSKNMNIAVTGSLMTMFMTLLMTIFFAMVLMTVLSGVHYCVKNRNLFADA